PVLLQEDTEPVGIIAVAQEGGADMPGLAIGVHKVEVLVERLAIGIKGRGSDGQLTFRIRVVKGDGLGDGIVSVEAIVVRLAVEVGIELDSLVVRRPADAVLDVGHRAVGRIFDIGDPGPPDQPCHRREWFGSDRGVAGFDCANPIAAKTASERNRVACMNRVVMFVLAPRCDARGLDDTLPNVSLAICPPTEHNSMFAFSSYSRERRCRAIYLSTSNLRMNNAGPSNMCMVPCWWWPARAPAKPQCWRDESPT